MSLQGRKISIIGAGNVGATIAYTLTLSGMAAEIALVDVNMDKATGEALDIMHGTSLCPSTRVYAGDYSIIKGSDIVIVAAGIGRKPGQNRIDLCKTNIEILRSVVPEVVKNAPDSVYVVVANPADILSYAMLRLSGVPENRVIGSGTLLDTSRLCTAIAEKLDISTHNVNAYVLAEHGETSMVPWSLCTIGGVNYKEYCEKNGHPEACTPEALKELETTMRTGGAEVIKRKGATFYAIAMSVARICEAVLRDTKEILPVAGMMHGEFGVDDVCLSLPYVVGANGLERPVEMNMTTEEVELFQKSGAALKSVLAELTF